MFSVTILGNNSAVPAFNRHPTSQVVSMNGNNFLVDCGEGTQIQMINYKIRRSKISHIFISHLHGDHYFGLVGLINSFGLLNRIQDLHVFGPPLLKDIIELQLKAANTVLPYQLFFHAIEKEGILVENDKFLINCFKTDHRIECHGFVFKEKKNPRRVDPEKAKQYAVPVDFYGNLQMGEDFVTDSGSTIKNEVLTVEGSSKRTYAFCADTRYDESIIPHIQDADMIYHESTYLEYAADKATERFHSTAKQAATIAKKANVKKLLIGHFSSKYPVLDEFEKEAKEVFENTELALEGVCYNI
jgi:ribonuclease Z